MIKLFTKEEFEQSKASDKLPCRCYHCNIIFHKTKRIIKIDLSPSQKSKGKFCSAKCGNDSRNLQQLMTCTHCSKEFLKAQKEIKKTKNHFCCQSCACTYNNKHKSYGIRRSKMEKFLEARLSKSSLNILFNDKTTIDSELDIYVPSLKLAFEINGIFHYQPIYGEKKFLQTQNNDRQKILSCQNKNIELSIIDISNVKHFSITEGHKILSIIEEKINNKSRNIVLHNGTDPFFPV